MRAGKRHGLSGRRRWVLAVSVLFFAGCSKPEEVISTRIAEANKKLEAGQAAAAVAILERVDHAYPEKPAVLEALGFAYAQAGKPAAAAASFVNAADIDAGSASLRQLAAESFVRDGALDRASEQLRLYLGEFPGDYQSWQKLGEIEEQRSNVARAIDAWLEWYRIRPEGEAAFRLGTAFRRLNNAPQAKTWFERTIKHSDVHIDESLLALLGLEREAGDLAAVERTVGQLDKNFPGVLDASTLAGVRADLAAWQQSQRELEAARVEQEKLARELEEMRRRNQPGDAPAATPAPAAASAQPAAPTQAGGASAAAGEPPAIPPRLTGPDVSPALAAAIERREAGDPQKAVELLWRTLSDDAGQVDCWLELADCYRELKQYTPAESCILEARRLAPEAIEVETTYLNIVRESQPADVFLTRLEEARRRFPEEPNLAYALASEAAKDGGDVARASAAYEDFLLLAGPDDPRRAEAGQYLARQRAR